MANDWKYRVLTSTAEHLLTPVRMTARETISELFHFEIEAVANGTTDARGVKAWACPRSTTATSRCGISTGIVEFSIEQSGRWTRCTG